MALLIPLAAVILPLVFGFLLLVPLIKNSHAQKMAMIEKGIIMPKPIKKINRFTALRKSMLMIGLGGGYLLALLMMPKPYDLKIFEIFGYPVAIPVLFAGICLFGYFVYLDRTVKKGRDNKDIEDNNLIDE